VEAERADAEATGLRVGRRVAARDPDRRVARPVRLRQDVVRLVDREVLALEGVVVLLPHAQDLGRDLVPLRPGGRRVVDVERPDLVRSGATPRAELEATAR